MKLPQADQDHFNLRRASYDSFILLVICGCCGFSSTKLENLFETLVIRLKDNFRGRAVPQKLQHSPSLYCAKVLRAIIRNGSSGGRCGAWLPCLRGPALFRRGHTSASA